MMDLYNAIALGDYDGFVQGIESIDKVLVVDEVVGGFLHAFVAKEDERGVSSFFTSKKKLFDYYQVINRALFDKPKVMNEIYLYKDDLGNTALHKAVMLGNWEAVHYLKLLSGTCFASAQKQRNLYGLKPLEMAVILWGVIGAKDELKGYFDSELDGMARAVMHLKSEFGKIKYLLHPENKKRLVASFLGDSLFDGLTDEPGSGLSDFKNDAARIEFKKMHGWKNIEYKDDLERAWPRRSVEDLLKLSSVEGGNRSVFFSMLCEFYSFVAFNYPREGTLELATNIIADSNSDAILTELEARRVAGIIADFYSNVSGARKAAYRAFLEARYNKLMSIAGKD